MNKKLFNEIKNMNLEEFQDFCANILKAREHAINITFNFETHNKTALCDYGNTSFEFLVMELYSTYLKLIENHISKNGFAELAASFISGSFEKVVDITKNCDE